MGQTWPKFWRKMKFGPYLGQIWALRLCQTWSRQTLDKYRPTLGWLLPNLSETFYRLLPNLSETFDQLWLKFRSGLPKVIQKFDKSLWKVSLKFVGSHPNVGQYLSKVWRDQVWQSLKAQIWPKYGPNFILRRNLGQVWSKLCYFYAGTFFFLLPLQQIPW